MKKKISYLFMIVLIACSLIMPCVADEPTTELVTEITTEVVTDMLAEPTETPTEGETATGVVTAPTDDENAPTGEDSAPANDEWETFKAKITDSATWTMIGTGLVTILTIVGTVKSRFDKISSLVHNKADNDTMKGELKGLKDDLKKAYNENHKEVAAVMKRYEEALKTTAENEQKLYAILTLFMTNCKISETAKAEILNILADVKKYSGDVSEFVAQAQEAIDNAKEEAPPTPTLDQMLEEDYMDLG
jgi:uncharacterized membrane-anchored protein YhcB (DUF1043 family)